MGALPDPVSVFIDLDVGSSFLHLLDQIEGLPVDDRSMMILGPLNFFKLISDPILHPNDICKGWYLPDGFYELAIGREAAAPRDDG